MADEQTQNEERPLSCPELALRLIMILPDLDQRIVYSRDFCRLYDIRERHVGEPVSGLGRIIEKAK